MLHAEVPNRCTRCRDMFAMTPHFITDLCHHCRGILGVPATPVFLDRLNANWAYQRDILKANPDGRRVPFSPFASGGAKKSFAFQGTRFQPKVVK